MTNRRSFLRRSGSAIGALTLTGYAADSAAARVSEALQQLNSKPALETIADDELWAHMAQAYTVSPNILNLNNGGVSPQPKVVQDAVDRYYHLSNEAPTYYMWQILDRGREPLRRKLAALAGVSPEEIAINRNTTEALGTFTWGIDLKRGDEIVMTKQDYPNMIHAWKQRARRDRTELLHELALVPGVYVPAMYHVEYDGPSIVSVTPRYADVPARVEKRTIADRSAWPYPKRFITQIGRAHV